MDLDSSEVIHKRIAMLIDGDNAQPKLIEKMIRETEKFGIVTIRKIYGDWTTPQMNSWKESLHRFAIQPVQQFRYTAGKNNTDSALIIDAMDILHSKLVDGFSIVSSDSDYTRLATRIREEGLMVIGIGQKKTPEAFIKACDRFIFTENIRGEVETTPARPQTEKTVRKKRELLRLLREAYDMCVRDDEWVHLAILGEAIRKIEPGFDPRTYGQKRLITLIEAFPKQITVKKMEEKDPSAIYISFAD